MKTRGWQQRFHVTPQKAKQVAELLVEPLLSAEQLEVQRVEAERDTQERAEQQRSRASERERQEQERSAIVVAMAKDRAPPFAPSLHRSREVARP
jgi:hypothetical protein